MRLSTAINPGRRERPPSGAESDGRSGRFVVQGPEPPDALAIRAGLAITAVPGKVETGMADVRKPSVVAPDTTPRTRPSRWTCSSQCRSGFGSPARWAGPSVAKRCHQPGGFDGIEMREPQPAAATAGGHVGGEGRQPDAAGEGRLHGSPAL